MKETNLIKCLTGQMFKGLSDMTTNQIFVVFQKSYFHLWSSFYLDEGEAFKVLREAFDKKIIEYGDDLPIEKQWLLIMLLTQKLISSNYQLHLLDINIEDSLDTLEEDECSNILEDVNLHQSILQQAGSLSFILKFSKYKKFLLESSVESDLIPTAILRMPRLKRIINKRISKVTIDDIFISSKFGDMVVSNTNKSERLENLTDILMLSFLDDMAFFFDQTDFLSGDVDIPDEEFVLVIVESVTSILSEMMSLTDDEESLVISEIASFFISCMEEDLVEFN